MCGFDTRISSCFGMSSAPGAAADARPLTRNVRPADRAGAAALPGLHTGVRGSHTDLRSHTHIDVYADFKNNDPLL